VFSLLRRVRLAARFDPTHAHTDEFARQMTVQGRLTVVNDGTETEIGDVEMMVIAGFRRIPLEIPPEWRALRLDKGGRKESDVRWTVTLDAPLRAERGELYVSMRDQRRKKWEWRLPFIFERR
jgi:hypothetical protein